MEPRLRTVEDWKRFAARREKERRSQGRLTSREQMIQKENERRLMALSEKRRREHKQATDRAYRERIQPGLEWLADKAKGRLIAERNGPDAYLRHHFNK